MNGGLVLILFSILMFFVGGGFIPPYIGIVTGIAGTSTRRWFLGRRDSPVGSPAFWQGYGHGL